MCLAIKKEAYKRVGARRHHGDVQTVVLLESGNELLQSQIAVNVKAAPDAIKLSVLAINLVRNLGEATGSEKPTKEEQG